MKEIVEKLKQEENNMAQEKGPFDLFALFLREDAPDKWDLVVAAQWIEKNKQDALKYITEALHESLTQSEILKLSRIAIIDKSNPALEVFQRAIHVEHGMSEIKDSNFFGLQIKHVYLITSQRREGNAPNNAINQDN
jgi:hypothetical protein